MPQDARSCGAQSLGLLLPRPAKCATCKIRNWIEKEKVDRILEAGRLAPSAKNRQQWRFILIEDKSVRERIKNAAYGQEYIEQAPY